MKLSRFLTEHAVLSGVIAGLLISTAILVLRSTGGLQTLELAAYDVCLRRQPCVDQPDPRLLIIGVTEHDIQELGEWPMSDLTLAQLLQKIMSGNPRAVGLDIYRDIPVGEGENDLRQVLSSRPNIVTVRKLGDMRGGGIGPPYVLSDNTLAGFNDLPLDSGGVLRRGLLFLDDGKETYQAFSLLLASLYLERDSLLLLPDPVNPALMKLGMATFIPLEPQDGGYVDLDSRGYQFLMNFRSLRHGFESVSLTEFMKGNSGQEQVRDRVVLVGTLAESTKDFFIVPVVGSVHKAGMVPGIEIHATLVSQLLDAASGGTRLTGFFNERMEIGWIYIWGIIGGLVGSYMKSFWRLVVGAMATSTALVLMALVAFSSGLWIPLVPPLMTMALTAMLIVSLVSYGEKAQRVLLMSLFSKHLSKGVAEILWKQRDEFMDGEKPRPQELVATVIFTDLQGFTSISEGMDVHGLMDWLNEYLNAMTSVVLRHDGVINKYMGDAIMAVFGIPVARTSQEEQRTDMMTAVACALEMGLELEKLNIGWERNGRPTVRMRVGIFSGPLIVGCVGSSDRLEYTVIGDTVNIASRLESYRKEYAQEETCRVLLGVPASSTPEDYLEGNILGDEQLKGKGSKIRIIHVKGLRSATGKQIPACSEKETHRSI